MLEKSAPNARYSSISLVCSGMLILSLLPLAVCAQSAASRNAASVADPKLVLIGTSRIGSRYSATLQIAGGKQVTVVSENDRAVPLPGFSFYTVTKIEPKRVFVLHLNDANCATVPDQNMTCADGTAITLELMSRALDPVTGPNSKQSVASPLNDLTDVPAAPGSFIASIQINAARRSEIPEVPNGMQLIETSLGFQLIPDD
jgi:hypothetical protein